KDAYWAEQVEIQRRAAAAWTARAEGKTDDALALMRSAAELEATTEKHNISPGPIVLARELLGDMLLEMQQPAKAIAEYEAALTMAPNRFKALYALGRAAELSGDRDKARVVYGKLLVVAAASNGARPELAQAADMGCVFMCGYPWALRRDRPRLLAAPVPSPRRYGNRAVYVTDFIVSADSSYARLEDTFGKTIAYSTEHSHSGYNAPRYHLLGYLTPERRALYGSVIGPLVRQRPVLDAVVEGRADVAAID